jgi:hypothetical protein
MRVATFSKIYMMKVWSGMMLVHQGPAPRYAYHVYFYEKIVLAVACY